MANKAKKNVAGKVATSALGKKAIRSHAPEEVKNLIKSINTLVEQESKGSKKAGEIEENIFKIGIKVKNSKNPSEKPPTEIPLVLLFGRRRKSHHR